MTKYWIVSWYASDKSCDLHQTFTVLEEAKSFAEAQAKMKPGLPFTIYEAVSRYTVDKLTIDKVQP